MENKTAQQFVEDYGTDTDYLTVGQEECMIAFAKYCVEKALEEQSNKATYIRIVNNISVSKESITNYNYENIK